MKLTYDFKENDRVEIISIQDNGEKYKGLMKRGIILSKTDCGAKVWDDQTTKPFTDSLNSPEWFPFSSKNTKMILVNRQKKRV